MSGEHELDCWTWAGWEPDRMYRRLGSNRATPYFGNGEWVPEWRERICSDEAIKMMADCGVTIAITYFYKGFGKQAESEEWPRLKEYVQKCHARGIKVWGYIQGKSLYRESLFLERPDAVDWVAKKFDGTDEDYGGAYYRVGPCITSEGYWDYLFEIAEIGLKEIGLDGLHLDNSYFQHCYCNRCKQLFRDELNAMTDLDARTGLPAADYVEPPPVRRDHGVAAEPIYLLWAEFGVRNRLKFIGSFYQHIKALKPEAILGTNPGFPRADPYKTRLLDPAREGQICDFLCAESPSLPRMEGDVLYSISEAYLYADAGDFRVFQTGWRKTAEGTRPASTPGLLWTGLAEEFSHHAAILGNNWLLRASGDGGGILGDNEELRTTHADAVHFFRGLHRELELGGRRQWAEVGIYINTDTMTISAETDLYAVLALQSYLMKKGVPVRFVTSDKPIPESVKTLLVVQQSCLMEGHLAEIQEFGATEGHLVWVAGESGRYDEWNLPRNLSRWRQWRESPGFVADDGQTIRWNFGPGKPVPAEAAKLIDGFLADPVLSLPFELDLPAGILLNAESTSDGRLLLHVRDQGGTGEPVSGVMIHFRPNFVPESVEFHVPGEPSRPLVLKKACLEVPAFHHYGLIVLGGLAI